jgi:alcohol dehydrogenase (cytochrome c)
MTWRWSAVVVVAVLAGATAAIEAQVSFDRIRRAAAEPGSWLTYSGDYGGHRHSPLTQITPANVGDLTLQWILPNQVFGAWQATPLVVDGIMYVTQRPNDVLAVDARTGRVFWQYRYTNSADARVCCGANNRGVAILGDTLYMGTLDAHLVAIDRTTGRSLWDVPVADPALGYSITMAPLVVKDKVLVGSGGGEYGIRGFIAAYDAGSGEEVWRFHTIPGPGEPGHETWGGDSWRTGGGSIWLTPTYDSELDLTYWGVGNPAPDWNPDQRPGDNLYTDSVVALDPDTGDLQWHFQFSPGDPYDYDSVQIGVLADLEWQGQPTPAILWANRNGFFYVLDRTDGRFLVGKPFVEVNWASGLDETGRPIPTPQPEGQPTYPGIQGGTNWYSPSFSPRTGLLYVSAWEGYASVFSREYTEYVPGRNFLGGGGTPFAEVEGAPGVRVGRASPINTWTDAAGHGAVLAIDPQTGDTRWTFDHYDVTDSGILTTATDLLYTGGREGSFNAIDARTGAERWRASLGGQIANGPVSYAVDGTQYVSVISGNSLVTFALR